MNIWTQNPMPDYMHPPPSIWEQHIPREPYPQQIPQADPYSTPIPGLDIDKTYEEIVDMHKEEADLVNLFSSSSKNIPGLDLVDDYVPSPSTLIDNEDMSLSPQPPQMEPFLSDNEEPVPPGSETFNLLPRNLLPVAPADDIAVVPDEPSPKSSPTSTMPNDRPVIDNKEKKEETKVAEEEEDEAEILRAQLLKTMREKKLKQSQQMKEDTSDSKPKDKITDESHRISPVNLLVKLAKDRTSPVLDVPYPSSQVDKDSGKDSVQNSCEPKHAISKSKKEKYGDSSEKRGKVVDKEEEGRRKEAEMRESILRKMRRSGRDNSPVVTREERKPEEPWLTKVNSLTSFPWLAASIDVVYVAECPY